MIIAGVGLEQDVTMENVDMKTGPETGTAGMAGFAASPRLLYLVILSVFRAVCGSIFGRLQAVGRYVRPPQGRRVRRAPVLPLPTLCLALAFIFFNAAGAMAQNPDPCEADSSLPQCADSTPPDGNFEMGWSTTHDGINGINLAIIFTEEVFEFGTDDIVFTVLNNSLPTGKDINDYRPRVSALMVDPDNNMRWTFTVTPITDSDGVSIDFSVTVASQTYSDGQGNLNSVAIDDNVRIMYVAPFEALVADAGTNKPVASGGTVTLGGSGSTVSDSNRTVEYAWTQTGGTGGSLTDADKATASFTAPALASGDADATHTFTLTVTDDQGSTEATDTVEITVLALLVADAGTNKPVASGGTVPLGGSGSTVSDSNRTVEYAWTQTGGTGGSLTDADKATASFTAPALASGDADATHTFTLTVTDNRGSTQATGTVEITVLALLVADAGTNKPVASGGTVTLGGSGSTVSDSNRTVEYAWTQTGGTGGSLTDADKATASFTAPALASGDADATHTFTLTVTDNRGSTQATGTVEITVLALLVADAGTNKPVASGGTVTLGGSGSTVSDSNRTVEYAWTQTGGTGGSLTDADKATASFTAPALASGDADATHTFTLTVTDNRGSTQATGTVEITVLALLVADAGTNKTVASGGTVTLGGSGSTVSDSNRTVEYAWTQTGGTGGSLTDADKATASFTAPALASGDADATHTFTLTVTDNRGSTQATGTVEITVLALLVADAGTNKPVASGGTVTLGGSGSTVSDSNRTVEYAWTQTGGTGGSLTDADKATASFTAPALASGDADATHTFTLTVTDNRGSTQATGTVEITVLALLVADAGTNKTVASGGTVTLGGSGSTVSDSNRTVEYAWTQTGGTGGSLTDADKATASFTAPALASGDADATHTFTLTVTDNRGSTQATGTVEITVLALLVADAGTNKPVASGGTVTLGGSGSTVSDSNRTVEYAWTQTGGTGGSLTDADKATASFTAPALASGDADATHTFTLTVTDNRGSTQATGTVEITVLALLVADAGTNKTVASGGTVTLGGSGSTVSDSNRTVEYAWTQTGGTGGSLTDADKATASFTAPALASGDADATHTFTLTVTDNRGSTQATGTVEITVFALLVADAGTNKTVASGGTVTLGGSGSTVSDSNRTVEYAWTQTGGTGGSLTDADKATASFTAPALASGDADATHTFTLTVTDNRGSTQATGTVEITVLALLVADAGTNKTVASGGTVTLGGSGSTVSDSNRTVEYAWTQTGGTGGSLTDADKATASFTAPALASGDADATHTFTLTVTDDQGSTAATDPVTVTVTAASVDIDVSPPEVSVQEGGSATYRVRLSEKPGREVIVMATSGNEDVVRLKDRPLVFDDGNWNEWQDVEINTVADSVKKDDRIEVTIQHSLGGVASSKLAVVTVTVRAQEDDPIPDHVGQFIATRATVLLNTQPDLTRFLKQDEPTPGDGGAFTFQATDGRLALDGGFIHNGVWGEVTGAWANSESGDTRSVLGSFGIHRKYSETFLAGALLQLDLSDHDLPGQIGTIDGTGWLVGPYFVARHESQPLYFEGRLLYGQSDNDIRFTDPFLGARTGSFDSARLLAQIRVEGEIAVPGWDHGDDGGEDAPRLIPYADMRWIEDRAEAFTTVSATGGRVPVPGQTVNVSTFELGSNIQFPVAVNHGAMTLTGGLGLVWSNTEGDHINSVARGRGRGEIGFSYGLDENVQIDFESFYDGIGSSRYEGYGLSLSAEMKF